MVWCSHAIAISAPRVSAYVAISNAAGYSSVVGAPKAGARMSKRSRYMPTLSRRGCAGRRRVLTSTSVYVTEPRLRVVEGSQPVDLEAAERAVADLLVALGHNPSTEG